MAIFFEAKNIGLNNSFTILFNFYNNNSKIILTYFNIHIHISIRSLQNEAIKNDICVIGPLYKKTFLFVCSRSCQVKHRQIFNFGTNNFFSISGVFPPTKRGSLTTTATSTSWCAPPTTFFDVAPFCNSILQD